MDSITRLHNREPIGFRRTPDGGVEEDPQEQKMLVRLRALAAEGNGCSRIARRLTAEGFTKGIIYLAARQGPVLEFRYKRGPGSHRTLDRAR